MSDIMLQSKNIQLVEEDQKKKGKEEKDTEMSSEDMEMAYEHLSALADKESDANEKDDKELAKKYREHRKKLKEAIKARKRLNLADYDEKDDDEKELSALKTQLTSFMENLSQELKSIKLSLNKNDANTRLQELQEQMNKLKTQIEGVN